MESDMLLSMAKGSGGINPALAFDADSSIVKIFIIENKSQISFKTLWPSG